MSNMSYPQIKTIASNGYEDEIDTITATLDEAVNQWLQFGDAEIKVVSIVPHPPVAYKNSVNNLTMILCVTTITYEEESDE